MGVIMSKRTKKDILMISMIIIIIIIILITFHYARNSIKISESESSIGNVFIYDKNGNIIDDDSTYEKNKNDDLEKETDDNKENSLDPTSTIGKNILATQLVINNETKIKRPKSLEQKKDILIEEVLTPDDDDVVVHEEDIVEFQQDKQDNNRVTNSKLSIKYYILLIVENLLLSLALVYLLLSRFNENDYKYYFNNRLFIRKYILISIGLTILLSIGIITLVKKI